jgi:hypothetical protein
MHATLLHGGEKPNTKTVDAEPTQPQPCHTHPISLIKVPADKAGGEEWPIIAVPANPALQAPSLTVSPGPTMSSQRSRALLIRIHSQGTFAAGH